METVRHAIATSSWTLMLITVCWGATAMTISNPTDRADRLIELSGERESDLFAEYSRNGGRRWHPATIYPGTTVDEWRTSDIAVWNRGVLEGRLAAGDEDCTWSYFFDVPTDAASVTLRLRTADGGVVATEDIDLGDVDDVFVIDRRNVAELAGGALPAPWDLKPAGHKSPSPASIHCPSEDPTAPALVIAPGVEGWHHVYVGMEPYSAFEFSVSAEGPRYAVPDYLNTARGAGKDRLLREFYVASADLTDERIRVAIGGARKVWRDASIRHIRLVPMTGDEIAHYHHVRELAGIEGRPFAAYVEQCTAGAYAQGDLDLQTHTRNEMRLARARGATDVYVHVIRVGSKAWYHSDIVQRCTPKEGEADAGWVKVAKWMAQGDPMQIALDEGHAEGLRVFPDMGMNVTYITMDPHYAGLTERMSAEHPEYLVPGKKMFLDYRHEQVRAYASAIARELMTKYDVDGINLDFARFGHNKAFDEASLVDVVRRIHGARQEAEAKWGHPITIATRIPSYRYAGDADWSQASYGGEHPWFTAALKTWAESGWVDRVMVCCPVPERFADLSLARYIDAISGTETEFWGDLYGGSGRPRRIFLDAARAWVNQGLDGGFFFYTTCRPTEYERIDWMLRLIDYPDVRVEPQP
jgi:hypothetical protein